MSSAFLNNEFCFRNCSVHSHAGGESTGPDDFLSKSVRVSQGVEEEHRVELGSPQSALGEGAVASSGAKPSDKLLIFNTGFYE